MTADYTKEELAAFLETIPYKALAKELARRNSERRKVQSGGRPKVLRPCPKCHKQLGARELAKHKCSG